MATLLSRPVENRLVADNDESEKVYFHAGSQPTFRKVAKHGAQTSFTSIPIIDISDIDSPSLEARKQIAREIHDACSTCGFFYLKNHGLSEDLLEETFHVIKRFFALDIDTKMDAYVHKNPAIRGYEPMLHSNMGKGDLKEAFTMGDCPLEPEQEYQTKTNSSPPATLTKPQNIWPSQAPWFREGLYKYYQAIFPLAMKLVRIFSLAFGLEENVLDPMFKFPITGMRPLFYPSAPENEEGVSEVMGLGAHADFSWLTLVLQDSVPALEVLNKDGIWIDANPIPNTFVCNVGQYLERQSNGKFVATVHRVRNKTGQQRYSLPFFLTMDPDVELEVLQSCVEEGEEPKFENVNVGQLYIQRVLPARKSHPTSIKYGNMPEKEWRYDFLLT